MTTPTSASAQRNWRISPAQAEDFAHALTSRRQLIYDYLDNWPGAESFRPRDIHDALFSYVRQRGKGLRPALLLFCCGAAGGDERQAIPAAAAIEIFHIWTLVHDDIIDRDATRRGHPTVHTQYQRQAQELFGLNAADAEHYGLAVGILAGDLQQSWSFSLLSDLTNHGVSPEIALQLINRMAGTLTPQLLEGEMLDVQYAIAPPAGLSEEDVLEMLGKKTAALLEYVAWAGAVIGLGGRPDSDGVVEKLARYAGLCGIAFQLQDDLLGLTADESVLGKPVGSDIREGKRTLIVTRAISRVDEAARQTIERALGNERVAQGDLDRALDAIRASGALEEVRELANSYIDQAVAVLDALPDSEYKSLLYGWAAYTLNRAY